MFSDSKRLIGSNPWFEDLTNSMENFNESCNGYLNGNGILTDVFIAELRSWADNMQTDIVAKGKLHDFLNMNGKGEFLRPRFAVELHQALLYKNVFSPETWNDLMPLVDVFYFNDAFHKFHTRLDVEFTGYEHMFPRLAKEMHEDGLLSLELFSDFDTYKQEVFPKIDELQEGYGMREYYKNAVKFIAESIMDFCESWKDSLPTVHHRLLLWMAAYDNSHYGSRHFE